MLVRHHPKGCKIISHYTHALFAGKIGSHLTTDLRNSHWPKTLTAIIDHDDNMQDFGARDYLTDAGTPRDFMRDGGSEKDAIVHTKSLYNETLQKSQWISILVSRHIAFLNKDSANKEMKRILEKMYTKPKEQRRLYRINIAMEDHLYSVLRFSDRLSLIICREEVPVTGRLLEINSSIGGETYFISVNEDETFCVRPYIFAKDTFEIDFEFKILEQTNFSSNQELEQCLSDGKVELQKIIFRK